MRILCCLNGTNAEQIGKALEMFSAVQPLTVGMLHVIDTRPRKDIDLIRERFLRPPMHPPHHPPPPMHPPHHPPREEEMSEAERASCARDFERGTSIFYQRRDYRKRGTAGARDCELRRRVACRSGGRLLPRSIQGKARNWSQVDRACCAVCGGPRALSGAFVAPNGAGAISHREIAWGFSQGFGHSRESGNPVCSQGVSKGLRDGFPLSRE